MGKKIFFFDFGETLVTLLPSKEELFFKAIKQINLNIDIDSIKLAYHIVEFHYKYSSIFIKSNQEKKKFYDLFNYKLCEILGITSYYSLINSYIYKFFQNNKKWVLFDDVINILSKLYNQKYSLGIIANWDHNIIELVGKLGIKKYFSLIISSQEIGIEKPDPDIFRETLKRTSFSTFNDKIYYIGNDYNLDIISSRSAGLIPVLIDRNNFYPFADCLHYRSLKEWHKNLNR